MKKASTKRSEQDIPELKREQLGKGVRGKYFEQFAQRSNVAVLNPEIHKAFPTSEAVNEALSGLLAIAREARKLTEKPKRAPRKRSAA
jgi:hypothetical protein